MSRILIATSPEKGHLNPMAGVAQWMRRMGHHVGWLCIPEPAPQLERLGVEVLTLPHAEAPVPAIETGGEALARLVLDEAALGQWIRGLLIDAVPSLLAPVREAVERFRPDVMALDGMQYAAVLAAHALRIPWAGVSSALSLLEPPIDYGLRRNVRALADERQALFSRHGFDARFRNCECLSPDLNVIFATEAFLGSDAGLPPATHLVGPSQPPEARGDEVDFPWERLGSKPVVYVSFGSQISWQPDLFQTMTEAAAPLGVTVVLSAGELADTDFVHSLPGDVVAVPYTPQRQLLSRVSVLVSHGGANSVMEALTEGVPMLLLPVCNDQPIQAHFLAKSGAGLVRAPRSLSVEDCREALRQLLEPGTVLRQRVAGIAASYQARDGAKDAAERILRLVA
ncbi:glycosyltransferase, MGT family [Myxococcus xanthus DK 1622]|uniref:Glycosyltransferase, MGT family n=1 Tax=Myxococcus xanthus (strain DK1622) TaxID=246197 RepID=Q1DFJ3_MYXXD|nr:MULTISPECIES: glycosyltransferase [Myxococcus]ABF91222.1 glycosyltransferase, MGT family [Myxococcus xanthus DK 1622]NOJ56752.1 glycosyltransferase family 1 protein [Myxococcus xanthus]QPM80024.1 glycosyltransferase family 1 protein [Myxococcus xanthus]QVW69088.1 glycosyltransferase family 1 protein [Myxococcus xanthus DZ2]QZZ47860.1 4'-demethylrebeccamycin synthase [Myxococcus xanthus]